MEFSEPVTVAGGGTPFFKLAFPGRAWEVRQARYESGSGSKTLTYRYTVRAVDSYSAGSLTAALPWSGTGWAIADRAGNRPSAEASLPVSPPAGFRVDGSASDATAPTVSGVSLSGNGRGASGVFIAGDAITVTVEFSEPVTVTGTPQVALTVGLLTRQADYASGSGTSSLVFRYTVAAGDTDPNGVSVGASALALNGGTIADDATPTPNAAALGLGAHAITDGDLVVNGGALDTVAPTVSALALSGTGQGAGGVFVEGDAISVTLLFDEAVTVTGTPQLALTVGSATRQAGYASGTGTTALVFRYTVARGDRDSDGIGISASALALNDGTIADGAATPNAAALSLAGLAVTGDRNFRVNGAAPDVRGPAVVRVAVSGVDASGVEVSGRALRAGDNGDKVSVTVEFDETVYVVGSPRVALTIGSTTRYADYDSGRGSASLVFRYTVVADDDDTDGIGLSASALALNGGTIRDLFGNDAALALGGSAAGVGRALRVDGDGTDTTAPTVTGVALSGAGRGANGVFIAGDAIVVTIDFSEPVTVTGTPQVALAVGAATRQADYASGSGTASLAFRYAVVSGDSDANGVGVGASALALNSGTIADAVNNAAALGLGAHAITDGDLVVDGSAADAAPTVTGVTLSGTGRGASGVFIEDDRIEATVEFSEPVTVTGTPQLALTIGAATKQADYDSGSGTSSLVFRYTVASGDADSNGISVAANALALNGGTIRDGAATPNAAALGLGVHAITDGDLVVNGSLADTVAPTVTGLTLSGRATGDGGVFRVGDAIEATVEFSEPVTVTGTPQLALGIDSATKQADYSSGSGTASLVFTYTVVSGDTDSNGISVAADALALNGGTVADGANNAAALGLGAHAVTDGDAVVDAAAADTIGPTVAGVTIQPGDPQGANGVFIAGDEIAVTVEFSEAVTVTTTGGTPRLALTVGAATRYAGYVSGDGTDSLVFRYTVARGDRDADGISIGTSALALNGGTIADAASNAAALGLGAHAISNDSGAVVNGAAADAVRPTVTGLTLPVTGQGANRVFIEDDVISVTVSFSEAVTVTGTPRLALTVGAATRYADYESSGSGTTSPVFRYTVAAGDRDADGISIGASALALNGGTIRDAGNNDAALALGSHAVTDGEAVVDGSAADAGAPTVAGLTLSGHRNGADEKYIAGDRIEAKVEFSEPVTVTGTPQLALTIGAATRQAVYGGHAAGSDSALVFRYTVAAADADANGISVAASALALNGGTILDAAGNAAALGLGGHAITDPDGDLVVDGGAADAVAPTVTGLTLSGTGQGAGGTFRADDAIALTVEFSEPVTVTGTPRLALAVGARTRSADYSSGSGTRSLVFRYTVVTGDSDSDGVSVGASALTLNGGTIRDAAAHDAALGLGTRAVTNARGFRVDGSAADEVGPAVTGAALSGTGNGASGVFIAGDRLAVTVEFDEAATVTGTPQAALTVGANTRQAAYVSGSGGTSLVFSYTVARADSDDNGVSVGTAALTLDGGTIVDDSNNAAALSLGAHAIADAAGFEVAGGGTDVLAPTVTGVTLSGSGRGRAGLFIAGDVIEATVEFHEAVTVTGTPRLALTLTSGTSRADYSSGSGTASLVFRYTVDNRDRDRDGISIAATALALNGGTIRDAANHDAALGLGDHAIANDADFTVDGGAGDAGGPEVAGVTIEPGRPQGAGGVFIAGDEIRVTVEFNERVTVTGTPRLALRVGAATRHAAYASGSGGTSLVFRYAVAAGDTDPDGISIGASALSKNRGTIVDAANLDWNETAHNIGGTRAITNDARFRVDGSATDEVGPAVTGVALSGTGHGASGVFIAGDEIEATVAFDEAVTVTGTPQLTLGIGAATKPADYASGSGTTSLVFRYAVVSGDRDADGISVGASALALNSGTTIRDDATNARGEPDPNDAALGLGRHAIANDADFEVDGSASDTVAPTVTGVEIRGRAQGASGAFIAGDEIEVTVEFSEPVTVDETGGTPQLALTLTGGTSRAGYSSGSGTASLVFSYTVAAGDADANGISVAATALAPNGGTIRDAAGNDAALGLGEHAVTDGDAVVNAAAADAVGPAVVGVTVSSGGSSDGGSGANGVFIAGDEIVVTVEFHEPATVSTTGGTPRAALTIGTATRRADYASGSGTTELVFRYAVAARDADSDGISVAADALTLNGGTIRDAAGNDAALGLGDEAITDGDAVVDGSASDAVAPTVTGVSLSAVAPAPQGAGGVFRAGDAIEATVEFSEEVTVTGTPRLALTIGSATPTPQADYASGSGTKSLVFRYTVVTGDADANGISVAANALALNGGTIRDAADNDATLDLGSYAITDGDLAVNGAAADIVEPTVTGVTLSGIGQGANGVFRAGDAIEATVEFSEEVTVTGTPRLALTIGSATPTPQADYASGSGTKPNWSSAMPWWSGTGTRTASASAPRRSR